MELCVWVRLLAVSRIFYSDMIQEWLRWQSIQTACGWLPAKFSRRAAIRLDLQRGQDQTEALRREVRTAREVVSANVCRIFDLVVDEQQDQFLAKLKSFTNLRVVADKQSSTGWKLEAGSFPGWENVPSW